tara:strand:- start:1070 stop:2326 length:1257 start_codon:yes stop_codon:yes gene_type:complete
VIELNKQIYFFIKQNILSVVFFFYLFFYIAGPALINIYVTLISIFCFIYIFLHLDRFTLKSLYIDKPSFFLIIFFIYALFVSIFKKNFNIDILSFFRYLIIYLFLTFYFSTVKKHSIHFKEILIFFTLLISIDGMYQYFLRVNVVGFEIFDSYRLTSFFRKEPIVGSFLLKTSLPLLAIYLLSNKKNILLILLLLFSSMIIFLSGERMPLLQYFFGIVIMILFLKNKKKLFTILIATSLILLIILSLNKGLLDRYVSTYTTFSTIVSNTINNDNSHEKQPINEHLSVNQYILNFKSGINVWSHNKIFGGGYRYYNKNCDLLLGNEYHVGCSKHPHNIYIELLSDYGLLGSIVFITFLFSSFYDFYKRNHNKIFIGIGILFISICFPLSTSQSIFSSYYGSVFFLIPYLMNYYSKTNNR